MSSHVLLERRCIDELLGTHRAAERMIAAVAQHVRLEVALLVEATLADATCIRPDAGVFAHVFTQPVGAGIRASTLLAGMRSLTCMTSQVLLQVRQLGKRLGADITGKRTLTCTHSKIVIIAFNILPDRSFINDATL